MRVGECIKSLRGAAGLMQRELAERVGVSASLLSLIEAGKREPTIAFLRDVGRAFGIPTGVLFAVALADDDMAALTPQARDARALTNHLFEAARHSLIARRMQDERAESRPPRSRRRA